MWSSLTASVSMNGPVPALKALRVKSSADAAASNAFCETIMPARSMRLAMSGENGALRLKTTVVAFGASTVATAASSPDRAEFAVLM